MLAIRDFVLAGNAAFTCTEPSGQHFTYRVQRAAKPVKGPAPLTWFVNLGISYDSKIYMGLLKDNAERLILTPKSRVSDSAMSYLVFQAMWWDAIHGKNSNLDEPGKIMTESGIRFQHAGRCCVCFRELTNPDSIEMGIGPECAGKLGV